MANELPDIVIAGLAFIMLALVLSWGGLMCLGVVALYYYMTERIAPTGWEWAGIFVLGGTLLVSLLSGLLRKD